MNPQTSLLHVCFFPGFPLTKQHLQTPRHGGFGWMEFAVQNPNISSLERAIRNAVQTVRSRSLPRGSGGSRNTFQKHGDDVVEIQTGVMY